MIEYLPLFKSVHIIGAVGWFGGLFMLVRVFVYHIEAFDKNPPDRDILIRQYKMMASRVYRIICVPGMTITWVFGCLMISAYIDSVGLVWFKESGWLHAKLLFVFLLSGYQHSCKGFMKKLNNEEHVLTSFQTRLYNEVPSVFLVIIVLLAVYKSYLNAGITFVGIMIFMVSLFLIAKWYKTKRTD